MKFHNIEPNNIENGVGIRTLLWVSGCFHNCVECHNPVTHDPYDGVTFDEVAMDELMSYLSNDYISGLTLTGGDCLCYYPEESLEIIDAVRNKFGDKKTIWLYTGFTLDWIIRTILSIADKDVKYVYSHILTNIDVLCDGKYDNTVSSKEYHWVGSTNQRVIDMKASIERGEVVFFEKEQEKMCTTNSSETNNLLKKFKEYLDQGDPHPSTLYL